MTKVTFGTGTFVLMNAGPVCPEPVDGLVTTVAWDLGTEGGNAIDADGGSTTGRSAVAYALEGSVFSSGAGIQWLRDGLGIIGAATELEPLARSVATSEGATVVPAFAGLGSPDWDPAARGTIVGLSRGVGRAHLARAMVEAMSFQARDVIDAMGSNRHRPLDGPGRRWRVGHGPPPRTGGGPDAPPVVVRRSVETTAIGAATLAGLAEGVWGSLDHLAGPVDRGGLISPRGVARRDEPGPRGVAARPSDRSRNWTTGGEGTA